MSKTNTLIMWYNKEKFRLQMDFNDSSMVVNYVKKGFVGDRSEFAENIESTLRFLSNCEESIG